MDGAASEFELREVTAAEGSAPALEAFVVQAPRPDARVDVLRHRAALLAAALAHVLLIAALLPRADALGEDGVALETIAVSIVDSVPVISAPETKPSESIEPLPVTEEPVAESSPETPEPRTEAEKEPEPEAPALALDMPPESEPPPPDAPVLPSRPPEPEPVPVVRDEPKPPTEKPLEKAEDAEKEQKEIVPADPPAPAVASAPLPSVTSAEAAPGLVRAYARRISVVLDKGKPRSRGLRGKLRLQLVVGSDGRAEATRLLETSGNPRLDDLILSAVARLTFPPPPAEMSLAQRTFNVPFEYR